MKPVLFGVFFIKGIQFGLWVAFALVATLAATAFAAATWGSLPNSTTGNTLSSTAWNDIVSHVNQLTSTIWVSGSNVGIGTINPSATLHVNGTIKSPKWNVTQPLNAVTGALPITSPSFTTNGGTLKIFASGSGFRTDTSGQIGMRVKIDGIIVGNVKGFTNEVGSHKSFVPNEFIVTWIGAGSHTITIESWNNTASDWNDFFSVTVTEFPW